MGLTWMKPMVQALQEGLPKERIGAEHLLLAWTAFFGQDTTSGHPFACWSVPLGVSNTRHRRRNHGSSLDSRRTALVSRAIAALDHAYSRTTHLH